MSWFQPQTNPQPQVVMNPNLPTAGKYDAEGVLHHLVSSVIPGLVPGVGKIEVNPNNTASVARTVQHEKVHALLDPLNADGTLDKLNATNPYYKAVASKITLEPGGDTSTEAPAYAATGETKQFGIPDTTSQAYKAYLHNQLKSINPKVADAYRQLSNQ
jgi:hypothetical protein